MIFQNNSTISPDSLTVHNPTLAIVADIIADRARQSAQNTANFRYISGQNRLQNDGFHVTNDGIHPENDGFQY